MEDPAQTKGTGAQAPAARDSPEPAIVTGDRNSGAAPGRASDARPPPGMTGSGGDEDEGAGRRPRPKLRIATSDTPKSVGTDARRPTARDLIKTAAGTTAAADHRSQLQSPTFAVGFNKLDTPSGDGKQASRAPHRSQLQSPHSVLAYNADAGEDNKGGSDAAKLRSQLQSPNCALKAFFDGSTFQNDLKIVPGEEPRLRELGAHAGPDTDQMRNLRAMIAAAQRGKAVPSQVVQGTPTRPPRPPVSAARPNQKRSVLQSPQNVLENPPLPSPQVGRPLPRPRCPPVEDNPGETGRSILQSPAGSIRYTERVLATPAATPAAAAAASPAQSAVQRQFKFNDVEPKDTAQRSNDSDRAGGNSRPPDARPVAQQVYSDSDEDEDEEDQTSETGVVQDGAVSATSSQQGPASRKPSSLQIRRADSAARYAKSSSPSSSASQDAAPLAPANGGSSVPGSSLRPLLGAGLGLGLGEVDVEPKVLVFRSIARVNVSRELRISNLGSNAAVVGFRIKTNAPHAHIIKPKAGFLARGDCARVRVITLASSQQQGGKSSSPGTKKLLVTFAALTQREVYYRDGLSPQGFWKRIKEERRKACSVIVPCQEKGRLLRPVGASMSAPSLAAPPADAPTKPTSASTKPIIVSPSSKQAATKAQKRPPPHTTSSMPRLVDTNPKRRSSPRAGRTSPRTGRDSGGSGAQRLPKKISTPSPATSPTAQHDVKISPLVLKIFEKPPPTLTVPGQVAPAPRKGFLKISNYSYKRWVAFKVKTNVPKTHVISPHLGFVAPRRKHFVQVAVRGPVTARKRQKLLVMFTLVPSDAKMQRPPVAFWSEATRYDWEDVVVPCEWHGRTTSPKSAGSVPRAQGLLPRAVPVQKAGAERKRDPQTRKRAGGRLSPANKRAVNSHLQNMPLPRDRSNGGLG